MIDSLILKKLSSILNKNNIVWAIGGSFLLYLHKIYDNPNDIDIWVQPGDIDKVRLVFSNYTEIKVALQLPEKYHYKIIFDNCEVDFVSLFYVIPNQKDFTYRINPNRIKRLVIENDFGFPCLSLEEWFIIYKLLNKKSKAEVIYNYLYNNPSIIDESILEACINENTLPKRIVEDVKKLIAFRTNYQLDIPSALDKNRHAVDFPPKPKLLENHIKYPRVQSNGTQLSFFDLIPELSQEQNSFTEAKKYYPSLRLIVNSSCNGRCPFCHHEGYTKNSKMSLHTITECAKAASIIGIPTIAVSGGEPTLRNDIDLVFETISEHAPLSSLHLVTNGAKLNKLSTVKTTIDTVNLSISSLDPSIACKYQNVNPAIALDALQSLPALHKNLNVVITSDNYLQIDQLIKYCVDTSISLTIMFELKEYDDSDLKIQKYVFDLIETFSSCPIITMRIPPIIQLQINSKTVISVKHPKLSSLPVIGFCRNCSTKCYERLCAIRVLPDGTVTPCLQQTIKSSKRSTIDKIKDIYSQINTEYSALSFLTKR